jgi:peptidoglycan LD-endopeptidase CwlK
MASRSLDDLHPDVKIMAERHAHLCSVHGIDLLIYCTYRSNDEQAAEYAKGRTAPGKIVTYAKPGQSKHNHTINGRPAALAYDAVPLVGGKAAWSDAALLQRMGELGEQAGLEWAGRWKKFKEAVHFQVSK